MAVSTSAMMKCEQTFKTPEEWSHFIILVDRLKLGLITGAGQSRAEGIFYYFEKLFTAKNEGLSSERAIITFDERNRKKHAGSWRWLQIDSFQFLRASNEFPISMPPSQPRMSGLQGANKGKGGANPNKPAQVWSDKQRTSNGICRNFDTKSVCSYDNCRFAHWCIKPGCAQGDKADHSKTECSQP